ncbi:MAG: hypothetical protein IJ282_05770 [Lachnospiraceae bacterium]|nr:hypothetical protein [Lachnospiraceae bacterium]
MADAEISYKLDLIVRLVDTTTGKRVGQKQIVFKIENQIIPFLRRDEGLYILLNQGRNDMVLEISAVGYLPIKQKICYEELSPKFPEVEVPLIPEVSTNGFVDMLTLEGCCPGLTSIEAVSLKKSYGVVDGYQERKQALRLYYSKPLEESSYAILHEQQQEFEEFRIQKRLDKLSVRLTKPLTIPCRPEEKIARIVHGRVDADGRYLLRVLEEGGGTEYLVRYVVNGNASFKGISTESLNLLAEPEEERN